LAAPGKVIESQVHAPSRSGLRAGRYELLTRLAAGGMGEVFIARQTSEGAFEKRVALKLLLPHLSHEEEFVHMFLDEARIAARMNHPNIVQIFDLGVADGRYFIAMALVEGASLSRLLSSCRAKKEPLPLPILRLLANGLCAGLSYAHGLQGPHGEQLGVVHRDVNPANVLVSTAGAVLLTDFGIAKAQDNLHRTRPGDVKGKYAYMAPEQLKAPASVDHRADLFALGITLYETATLTSPFSRPTDVETMDAVRNEPMPDVRSYRPDATMGFAAALRRATAKEASERFPSARAFGDALLDGPMASPQELGEWVATFCATEIAVFRGVPAVAFQEVGTRSLIPQTRTTGQRQALEAAVAAARPPVRRRLRSRTGAMAAGFLLGVLVVLAGVAFRLLWTQTPESPGAPLPALAPALAEVHVPDAPQAVDGPEREPGSGTAAHPHKRPSKKGKGPEVAGDELLRVGYLTADAKPWAAIFLEGQQIDRTPLSRYPLSIGEHVLVFKNPELRKEVTRKVTIEEGKVATVRVDFAE
jgi:hypothetical protein